MWPYWPPKKPTCRATTTGSALAATSNIHRQMPTYMADICRDWLTNQMTDWCFVVIGLGRKTSHSPLQQLKIDPVRQLGPPYWLASSGCHRIFIYIHGYNQHVLPRGANNRLKRIILMTCDREHTFSKLLRKFSHFRTMFDKTLPWKTLTLI